MSTHTHALPNTRTHMRMPDRAAVLRGQGGYWEAKRDGSWLQFHLPPLYDV